MRQRLNCCAYAEAYEEVGERSADPLIANAMFAEQENAVLANLKLGAVHMSQMTLLWLIRLVLHERAKDKQLKFIHRDKGAKRARRAPDAPQIGPAASTPAQVHAALGLERL